MVFGLLFGLGFSGFGLRSCYDFASFVDLLTLVWFATVVLCVRLRFVLWFVMLRCGFW